MSRRILFVDDEMDVLDGLRRLLRKHRREWQMEFVTSGAEALKTLEIKPFDVIVTDMKMPGMNGADLLAEVAAQHPEITRVVLSGQTDEKELFLSAASAHQYLAKPCSPDRLEHVIDSATHIQAYLSDPELLAMVASMAALPSFPAISASIMREMESDSPSIARVAEIARRDIAVSAKLLQLVNSPFFGLAREITDVSEAVTLLGTERVFALVTAMKLFTHVPANAGIAFDGMWQQSLQVALWSEQIGRALDVGRTSTSAAYMGGLLSLTGRLIYATHYPDRYLRAASNESQISDDDSEIEEFGATAPQLGAYVLGLWGLPGVIVESAGFHRRPSAIGDVGRPSAITAVHVASALSRSLLTNTEPAFDHEHLDAVGIDDRMDELTTICLEAVE